MFDSNSLVVTITQPDQFFLAHALPEGRCFADIAVVGADFDPDGQFGAAVRDLAQGGEGVVAIGQVQIAVPAYDHGFKVFCLRAQRVFTQIRGGLVQAGSLNLSDGQKFLGTLGTAHILAVVVKLLADGAIQIVQVLLGVVSPGRAIQIALPAAELVVNLIVANGSLGGMQLFDADFDDIACFAVQIGGVARRFRLFSDGWRHDGGFGGVAAACAGAAVAGCQGQGQQGDTQGTLKLLSGGDKRVQRNEVHGPLGILLEDPRS